LDDFLVFGEVHQHRDGILGDGRIIFYQKFQVFDGFELIAFEERRLRRRVTDQILSGWDLSLAVFGVFELHHVWYTDLSNLRIAMMEELHELTKTIVSMIE
jgi:hypothetical protein